MQILIQLHYLVNGGKSLQQGDFIVNERNYKLDPDKEASKVAYEFYKKVKREHIYDVNLYKALYNGNDITELVKEIDDNEKKPLLN